MKLYRILLKQKGIIEKILSSETIFGAICWGIHNLYNDKINLQDVLNDFNNWDKKFIPTSTFPLLKVNNGPLYFYPKPIFPDPKIEELEKVTKAEEYKSKIIEEANEKKLEIKDKTQYAKRIVVSEYKRFKEIEYLSETLFTSLVKGEKMINLFCQYLKKERRIIKDNILLTTQEFAKIGMEDLMKSRVSVRNKIDRLSFSTVPGGELYYEEEIYLNREIFHLYFLLLTEDINFFAPVFRWLSDTGIGGNRTLGRGHYDIEIEGEVSLPSTTDGNIFISLSKYLPANKEIDWQSEKNYYELLPYQPRFDTMFFKGGEFIKDRITYLKEGSILQSKEKREYYGTLHPSAKFRDQTIYQCGLTIPVFIKMEQ